LVEVLPITDKRLGKKVNVDIKAIDIPNAIIFPNSITGFRSPNNNDRNAIAVVRAAKKQGRNIWLIDSLKASW
jgi:hypothetical protein